MPLTVDLEVLMVVPGDEIAPGLHSTATRHGWPVVKGQSVRQVIRDVILHDARVILVQLDDKLEQTMAMIQSLRQLRPQTWVVAAAVEHHDLVEQAARIAGVTCYLPNAADESSVDEALDGLAEMAERAGRHADTRTLPEVRSRMPKPPRGLMPKLGGIGFLFAMALSLFAGGQTAQAATYTLADSTPFDNSQMTYDDTGNAGVTSWAVDSIEEIFAGRMSFFWRFGTSGGESSVGALTLTSAILSGGAGPFPNPNPHFFLDLTYTDPITVTNLVSRFNIRLTYDLAAGTPTSGTASVVQTAQVTSLAGNVPDINFPNGTPFTLIEYNDLNLTGGTPLGEEADDQITILPAQHKAFQSDDTSRFQFTQTGGSLSSNIGQFAYQAGQASTLLSLLTDGAPTTLTNTTTALGPNAAFAFQWEFNLKPPSGNPSEQAGTQYNVSILKLLTPVPEPTTVGLVLLGTMSIGSRPRRRHR